MSTSKKKAGGGFQSFGMIRLLLLVKICESLCIGLSSAMYKGVMKKGYRLPTPIQRKVIVLICCVNILFGLISVSH